MSPPPPAISRASGGAGAGAGRGRGAIFSADTALTPDTTTWPGPGACLVRPRQVRGQTRGHKAARRQVAGGRWLGCGGQWLVCWPRLGWRHCSCRQSCPAPAPPPRHLCVITWCQEVTSPGSRQRPDSRGDIMNIVFPTEQQRLQSNILFVSIEFQIISSFCPPVPGQFQQTQFFPVLMR